MTIDPAWIATFVVSILFGVLSFFVKRLIENNDKRFLSIVENDEKKYKIIFNTLELIKDKQINQSEKRVEHTTYVNGQLEQLHKDLENVFEEVKKIPKLTYDVNNLGDKVRKLED